MGWASLATESRGGAYQQRTLALKWGLLKLGHQKTVCVCFSEILSFPNRKAIEELLKEAKRGKTRAETMGPMGW